MSILLQKSITIINRMKRAHFLFRVTNACIITLRFVIDKNLEIEIK